MSTADVVIVANVVMYTVDSTYVPPKLGARGFSGLVYWHTLNRPGNYKFEVEQEIKGKTDKFLSVNLPLILSDYYDYAKFKIGPGTHVLLFLKRDGSQSLSPVDRTVPLVPLSSSNTVITSNKAPADALGWIIRSLSNPVLRQSNTFLLRDISDKQLVIGLVKYINDPNVLVQDNVLYCMATNQQVDAIPRIRALAEKTALKQIGLQCPTTLDDYRTPEARPYLHPLLFSQEYFTRLHAMYTLDHLADHTSIPYFVLALRDPDTQDIIPQSAYGMLHKLIPMLGSAQGNGYFATHRSEETRRLNAWWSDELSGKHLRPGDKPAATIDIPDDPVHLDSLLFVPYAATRQAAMTKLETLADAASIPYLVLALQDPDSSVAYSAYKTLYRLIPALGTVKDKNAFSANRSAESQPIYDWWQDELMGRHLK